MEFCYRTSYKRKTAFQWQAVHSRTGQTRCIRGGNTTPCMTPADMQYQEEIALLSKMNLLGQGFQELDGTITERQTDRCDVKLPCRISG